MERFEISPVNLATHYLDEAIRWVIIDRTGRWTAPREAGYGSEREAQAALTDELEAGVLWDNYDTETMIAA